MQKYGDFWLIPKNKPYSLQSCCDGLGNLRQRERYRIKYVVVAGVRPRLLSSHIIFMLYFYYFHSLNGGVWQQVVTSPFLNVVNSRFAKKLPDIEVSAVLDCTDSERQWN